MDQATGVAVDASGKVYVGDSHAGHRIVVFYSDGTPAGTIGSGAGNATAGDTDDPRSIALGPDGDLYVADLGATRLISRVRQRSTRVKRRLTTHRA
jgi:sugar lactone lactonase YvrE